MIRRLAATVAVLLLASAAHPQATAIGVTVSGTVPVADNCVKFSGPYSIADAGSTCGGSAGVTSFNTRTGAVTLSAADVRTAVNLDRFYFDIPANATGLYSYIRAAPQPAGSDDGIAFQILGGDGGTTDGIGGGLVFGAGAGYGADGAGGFITIGAGQANGSAAGGTLQLFGGAALGAGHGGAVEIAPGLSASGTNGDLIIANIKTTDSLIVSSWYNNDGVLTHTGSSKGLIASGATFKINSVIAIQNTAPTLSGCGTGATVTNNACTLSFNYAVGTSPGTTCTITLPTASHGWHCTADDITTTTEVIHQTGVSTTTCVLTYYAITTGLALAPTASNNILVTATAY